MKFGPVLLEDAQGKILGHNVAGSDGRRRLRKGKPLDAADIAVLAELGRRSVYVAEIEEEDVEENRAALRVAEACRGMGLRLSSAATGRVNIIATEHGLARVEDARLGRLNEGEGITVATVGADQLVRPGQTVATVKVIPYAVPEQVVTAAVNAASPSPLRVDAFQPHKVGLILSGSPSVRTVLEEGFLPLEERVRALGSEVTAHDFVDLSGDGGEVELATALVAQRDSGAALILLAGETAIMDRHDITPRAVERAGGRVETVGAPVDPGNLLMLAYLDDIPVLGAPGCARSRKVNIVDWILPRLLTGERLGQDDIRRLGCGGLLEDVPERPLPRSRIG